MQSWNPITRGYLQRLLLLSNENDDNYYDGNYCNDWRLLSHPHCDESGNPLTWQSESPESPSRSCLSQQIPFPRTYDGPYCDHCPLLVHPHCRVIHDGQNRPNLPPDLANPSKVCFHRLMTDTAVITDDCYPIHIAVYSHEGQICANLP